MDQAFISLDSFVEPTSSQRVQLDVLRQSETEIFVATTRPEVHQSDSFESYFEEYYDTLDTDWPSPTPIENNLLAHGSELPPCKCSAKQISTTNDENHTTALGPTQNSSTSSYLRWRNTFVDPRHSSSQPCAETSSSRSPTEVQSECLIRKEVRSPPNPLWNQS